MKFLCKPTKHTHTHDVFLGHLFLMVAEVRCCIVGVGYMFVPYSAVVTAGLVRHCFGEARRPPRQRPCRDNIFPKEFRKHFKVFKVALLVAVLCMLMWYSNYLIV